MFKCFPLKYVLICFKNFIRNDEDGDDNDGDDDYDGQNLVALVVWRGATGIEGGILQPIIKTFHISGKGDKKDINILKKVKNKNGRKKQL